MENLTKAELLRVYSLENRLMNTNLEENVRKKIAQVNIELKRNMQKPKRAGIGHSEKAFKLLPFLERAEDNR